MSWELWAIPSGNLITATETEAEALDVARGLLLTDWRADELSLIFEDESKPIEDLPPALTGDALARRAAVPSSARRISA